MDLSAISQAASSLSTAVSLLKTVVSMRDEANRLVAVNEILSKLFEANSKLLAFQITDAERAAEHETVLREKRELEEKLRDIERHKEDLGRYDLHELSPGIFVYSLRYVQNSTEPPHFICGRCRNEGKKSILQRDTSALEISLTCPVCKAKHPSGEKRGINVGLMR